MAEILLILTILVPWVGAVVVWAVGDRYPRAQHGLAVAFSVAAGLAAIALLFFASANLVLDLPVGGVFGNFTFAADGLGVFLAAIATVIGCLAVVFSVDYMHGEAQLGRYYAFVLFFIGAMVGLVLTTSLLLMFVFWEITALCSYALIAFHNDDPKAVAGGMKALIITQFGGIGLLAGALLLYSYQGSYDISTFLLHPEILPAGVLAADGFWLFGCRSGQICPIPVSDLVAGCNGSSDTYQCPDPCRNHGQCWCVSAGTVLPCVCRCTRLAHRGGDRRIAIGIAGCGNGIGC